jgi:diguanylate cyclase (GGDEF)-like protein
MAEFEAFDLLPAQIAVLDREGGIAFTNHAWDQTAEGRLPDRRWNYLEECAAAADRGCAEARAIGTGLGLVLARELDRFVATYNCPFDDRHHWFQISARPGRATDDEIGAIVMHTDVTALQYDHLTGLANRALFEAQSEFVLDVARRAGSSVGIALIDLDGFKGINDEFGHAVGDEVLVRLAQRLLSATSDKDLVARVGGDEFAIVTGAGATEVGLAGLLRNVENAFKEPFVVKGAHRYLSASVGAALFPADGKTHEDLLKTADSRMYGMKRATGGRHEKWLA